MEKNTVIIILVIVLAVIVLNKESFIITTNEDKLATNIYFDASTNLLKYGVDKNNMNFEAAAKDASGNTLYIVADTLTSDQMAGTNYVSSPTIKLYKDSTKKDLVSTYLFGAPAAEEEENLSFNAENPWILYPVITAGVCTLLCLICTFMWFSARKSSSS
jgi:hypothetical protein